MAPVKFDVESITLDEMIDVEIASGRDFLSLLRSRTGRLMMARYLIAFRLHEQDTSQPVPTWRGSDRILDSSDSDLPLSPDGPLSQSDD